METLDTSRESLVSVSSLHPTWRAVAAARLHTSMDARHSGRKGHLPISSFISPNLRFRAPNHMLLLSSCLVPSLLSASTRIRPCVASRPARSLYMMGKNEFHMMGKRDRPSTSCLRGHYRRHTGSILGVGLGVATADT